MNNNAVREIGRRFLFEGRLAFMQAGGPQGAGAKPGGLVAALKSEAPPTNPATPNERINPQQQGLEHLKASSISLERSKEFIEDPMLSRAIDAMIGAINKALLQFDGISVMTALQASVGASASPQAPPGAPGMGLGGPPPGGPPQSGLGQTPAAPPVPGLPGAA